MVDAHSQKIVTSRLPHANYNLLILSNSKVHNDYGLILRTCKKKSRNLKQGHLYDGAKNEAIYVKFQNYLSQYILNPLTGDINKIESIYEFEI